MAEAAAIANVASDIAMPARASVRGMRAVGVRGDSAVSVGLHAAHRPAYGVPSA